MSREHAIIIEGNLRIPANVFSFKGFQDWVASRNFPERGRIDFLAGDVVVDMSSEDLQTHSPVKIGILMTLAGLILGGDRGQVYTGRTRIVCAEAGVSVEPDVV